MKYLFVFLVVCLTSSVIGQNRYHISETWSDELEGHRGVVLTATGKSVTGILYDERENGQLWLEKNYKDGNLISKKCWDEEGNEEDCP